MALKPWRAVAADLAALAGASSAAECATVAGARGRVLAVPARAANPLPALTHAVMDGYALGSMPPGRYRLTAGMPDTLALDEACPIAAGEHAPHGAVAVVLGDRASVEDRSLIVSRGMRQTNIRRAGEEAGVGDVVLKAGVRLDARHQALASAAGLSTLAVRRAPRVALAGVHGGPAPLQHLLVMASLLDSPALRFANHGVAQVDRLQGWLERRASDCDAIVIVAESLGAEDGPLHRAIAALGGAPVVHRAAMKPAKPVIAGRIGGCAVVGFAGTAYAVAVAAHLLLRPVLARLCGCDAGDPLLPAVAGFSRARAPGRAESLPARLQRDGDAIRVVEAGRFGQLSALAAMDGFALVEAEAGDVQPGMRLAFHPLLMPLV